MCVCCVRAYPAGWEGTEGKKSIRVFYKITYVYARVCLRPCEHYGGGKKREKKKEKRNQRVSLFICVFACVCTSIVFGSMMFVFIHGNECTDIIYHVIYTMRSIHTDRYILYVYSEKKKIRDTSHP